MNIKLHKYLLLYVVVLLNSCVDAQKKRCQEVTTQTKKKKHP